MANPPAHVSAAELDRRTRLAQRAEYDGFVSRLPHGVEWDTACALYTRESDPNSLVGDAAVNQLRTALELMAAVGAVPPWENVYFENLSGTEVATRQEFQALLQRAMSGEFRVIGAYMSHRLFRNADEASAVKTQLRRKGIQFVWVGKPVGLDERDPTVWLMERNADTQDEWHSRQTGWLVGRQLEFKTGKGEPLGHLPECWRAIEWAASLRPGQVGRPTKWELAEPMATIVKQAAAKYLGGESFREIATWSQQTVLGGVTPAGRAMDWVWWNQLLKNPKLAGVHRATRYPGFKRGKDLPAQARTGKTRELVPCLLPALITLEEHEQIVARGFDRHRSHGAPSRHRHGAEILSGIAYDARCGHRLRVSRHEGSDYLMSCSERGFEPHGSFFPARHAGEALAQLVGSMELDERLVDHVVQALAARANEEPIVTIAPDPAAAHLRVAIAAVKDDPTLADMRRSLEGRLRTIEARPIPLVTGGTSPQGVFRRAVASLGAWREVWADATPAEMNKLLRAAGVQAFIEPVPHRSWGRKKVPGLRSRLIEVRTAVPEFALALHLGCLRNGSTSGITGRANPPTTHPRIVLPPEYSNILDPHDVTKAACSGALEEPKPLDEAA